MIEPAAPAPAATPPVTAAPAPPPQEPQQAPRPSAREFAATMRTHGLGRAPAPPAPSEPATPPIPDGHVRIEIPAALQGRFGKEFVVPKGQEELYRSKPVDPSVLTAAQREVHELRGLRTQAEALRQENIKLKAGPAAGEKFRASPQYADLAGRLRAIEESERDGFVPEGTAALFRETVFQPAQKQFEDAEVTSMTAAERAMQAGQAGEAWMRESWGRTLKDIPASIATAVPNLNQIWREEVEVFNERLARGYKPEIRSPEAAHAEFRRLFRARLTLEPKAAALIVAQHRESKRAADERRQAPRDAASNPLGMPPTSAPQPKMNAKDYARFMRRR